MPSGAAQPQDPPVKPVCAILHREGVTPGPALERLQDLLSPADYQGPAHPFDVTDYYEGEMGRPLSRTIAAFSALAAANDLAAHKHAAAAIEAELAPGGARRFNLDVGYLDLHKVVLASFKARGNKIYLQRGVWADMTLRFEGGRFIPLPWSFPDFRDGRYDSDFLEIRRLYKASLAPAETS